jgi:hypothetical protein
MNFSPGLVFKSSINRTDKFAGIARNRGAMKSDKHSSENRTKRCAIAARTDGSPWGKNAVDK